MGSKIFMGVGRYRAPLAALACSWLAAGCSAEDDASLGKSTDFIIFGDDDRQEYSDLTDSSLKVLADSTAAVMYDDKAGWCSGSTCTIDARNVWNVCSYEQFGTQDQAEIGGCSAWLVAPDLVVTAGHCFLEADCGDVSFAFGWKVTSGSQGPSSVPADDVYDCDDVLQHMDEDAPDDDYMLVRLDRKVGGRPPFHIRRKGGPSVGDPVSMIGYPYHLPVKIDVAGAIKFTPQTKYFEANLDAFTGNSGSVVFGTNTRVAEGILVRGFPDWEWDSTNSCQRFVPDCDDIVGCTGLEFAKVERITRMNLEEIPLHTAIVAAVL